jgi:secreted endo-1,4-beta-xylanase
MTKKSVSLIGVLFVLVTAVFVITGCKQANKTPAQEPAPTPAPAPTPTPTPAPEPTIEGIQWKCTYTIKTGWEGTILTLNGTTATFKDPGKDAINMACVIDKANKKVKLVFSSGDIDEYDYAVKENGTVLELSMQGTLWHKFKKI